MEAVIELSTQIALLTQELQRRLLEHGWHQRVAIPIWNPCKPMEKFSMWATHTLTHTN